MSDLVILLEEIEAYQKAISAATERAKRTGNLDALEAISSHIRNAFEALRDSSFEHSTACNCCLIPLG